MTVHENEVVIFQLLTVTHYHFLFSTACLMRCHLSEAFASARVAIDAALIAAQIIYDRASQTAYAKREKPFDSFARYLGNLIKDKKSCLTIWWKRCLLSTKESAPLPVMPTLAALFIE